MKFQFLIDSGNYSVTEEQPMAEVARLLREVADRVEAGHFTAEDNESFRLLDYNGQPVGAFGFGEGLAPLDRDSIRTFS